MKIAIHHRTGSFSDRWIAYCDEQNIPYVIVNAFDNDIIEKVKGCDVFIWHVSHINDADKNSAKSIIITIETLGIKVFPNFNTVWHFDDKIAQKILFEAQDIPRVKTFISFDKITAMDWVQKTSFPKVFKLSKGAGALNVRLVKTDVEAKRIIRQAFSRGFKTNNRNKRLFDLTKKVIRNQLPIKNYLKYVLKDYLLKLFSHSDRERGYVYFQEFYTNNQFDTRIIVIGDKAFGIRRFTRENDFRASGSGKIDYDISKIDLKIVETAFFACKKLSMQCAAFDFIYDDRNTPLIVEVCFGFMADAYDNCEGYWTNNLEFHREKFNPYGWMIDNLIKN